MTLKIYSATNAYSLLIPVNLTQMYMWMYTCTENIVHCAVNYLIQNYFFEILKNSEE